MKALKIMLLSFLLIAMAAVSYAVVIPVTIERVELDDVEIFPNGDGRLDVERGQSIDFEIILQSTEDLSNVEIQASLTGFEFSDNPNERAFVVIPTFDADKGIRYVKRAKIMISDEFEEDNYQLRIFIADRDHESLVEEFNVKIDVKRRAVRIDDISLFPSGTITGGSALLTTVRIENKGEKEEDDVKVTVSIPELGIEASDFIDEIENDDDEEETEEIFLKIPKCPSREGTYDVDVLVEFNEGRDSVSASRPIEIKKHESCDLAESPKTTITVGSQMETFSRGAGGVFPITVTNSGKTSKSFSVSVAGGDWASVKVTPSSTMVIDAGKTQTFYLFVQASEGAPLGTQVLTATISSGSETLQQVPLTANVTRAAGATVRRVLEIALIILVVLLIIIGLIIGFTKLRAEEEPAERQQPAYY